MNTDNVTSWTARVEHPDFGLLLDTFTGPSDPGTANRMAVMLQNHGRLPPGMIREVHRTGAVCREEKVETALRDRELEQLCVAAVERPERHGVTLHATWRVAPAVPVGTLAMQARKLLIDHPGFAATLAGYNNRTAGYTRFNADVVKAVLAEILSRPRPTE